MADILPRVAGETSGTISGRICANCGKGSQVVVSVSRGAAPDDARRKSLGGSGTFAVVRLDMQGSRPRAPPGRSRICCKRLCRRRRRQRRTSPRRRGVWQSRRRKPRRGAQGSALAWPAASSSQPARRLPSMTTATDIRCSMRTIRFSGPTCAGASGCTRFSLASGADPPRCRAGGSRGGYRARARS